MWFQRGTHRCQVIPPNLTSFPSPPASLSTPPFRLCSSTQDNSQQAVVFESDSSGRLLHHCLSQSQLPWRRMAITVRALSTSRRASFIAPRLASRYPKSCSKRYSAEQTTRSLGRRRLTQSSSASHRRPPMEANKPESSPTQRLWASWGEPPYIFNEITRM